MDILKKHLTNGQYLTTVYDKLSQFLHHTVGTNAKGAWRWWNATPDRVGTAQMIDRDGSIWECFPPEMWAFHLGVSGDDNWHEKHSINIEIVAAGPLRFEDGQYIFYPLWPNKVHQITIPKDEVFTLDKAWKGHRHWHKYTDAQIESLKWQIGKNALDFPKLGLDNDIDKIFEFNQEVLDDHLPGIWTHNTVREDKSDVFPYPPLITALKEVQAELTEVKKATVIPEVEKKAKKITKPKSSQAKSKPKS